MNLLPLIQRNHKVISNKVKTSMDKTSNLSGSGKPENTLVIIRHGSTSMNGGESDDRIRGWLDLPLSKDGAKEVEDSVPALKKAHIFGLIASDLTRTKQTAEIISRETGIPILGESAALRPWNLGSMAGQKTKEVLPIMQQYIKDYPDQPVPGGESFNQFKTRFIRFVQEIQKKYPNEKIAIVTHHRGERLVQGWIDAGKPNNPLEVKPDAFMEKGIPPGKFTDHEIPPPVNNVVAPIQ